MSYLELRGITKSFPGVLANDHVDLTVEKGEIHALVGENGAGKTTLMRILYGLEQPDEGEIRLGGKRVTVDSPATAIRLGIGMVHQYFQLVPSMTVLENVVLGAEPARLAMTDHAAALSKVQAIATGLGISLPWEARVADLSLGPQQRVETLKALYRHASILIFDEPTTVLTAQEADQLFDVLRRLANDGATIIIITHKLHEVMSISSRITVMRRGHVAGVLETAGSSPHEIARLMVGEDVSHLERSGRSQPGEEVLSLDNLSALDKRGAPALRGLTLSVRRGEIVGIAGVEGNGQTEMVQAITGLIPVTGGTITITGRAATSQSTRQRREWGLGIIPGDRNAEGVSKLSTITDNMACTEYYKPPLSHAGVLNEGAMQKRAKSLIERFSVKAPSPSTKVGTLSGGNVQKIVVGRELASEPQVLIAAYPSRGVDVRSTELIHSKLLDLRANGQGVLLISEDLGEILSICDRVLVLYEGRIAGEVPTEQADIYWLGELMIGGRPATNPPGAVVKSTTSPTTVTTPTTKS
ncbi:MAG: ABC transporter ATP-binding protein [Chloroflexota bacterium]